ncbi:MAG: cation:proton antiporter [Candidatus Thorarchaeota archaeon]|nr:MAG: cation:proton antiporter [Candidatus Thorarchaeota archaeon]
MQELMPTDILLVIGAALVLAFIGAALMKKVGIPEVLGFMIAGLVLGTFTPFREAFNNLQPVVDLALGLIGYNIGLEIRKDVFKGRTKQMGTILAFESVLTFVVVTLFTGWILNNWYLAIVFGGLASATDPASTVMVIWEKRCKGYLTDTLMFVLAMDDVVAIVLANVAISIAVFFYAGAGTFAIGALILEMLRYLGVAAFVGGVFGAGMVYFINRGSDRSRLLEFELGMIILLVGAMVFIHSSSIFACMVFGFVVGNYVQSEKDPVSHTLKVVMTPIVMIFFVIVAGSPDFGHAFNTAGVIVVALTIVYVVGRTVSKYVGALAGAKVTNSPPLTTRYLGFCLMSQAGVAVGLALVIEFELKAVGTPEAIFAGELILSVIILTTMILQIFGPVAASEGLRRAGESPDDLIHVVDLPPNQYTIEPLSRPTDENEDNQRSLLDDKEDD